MPLLKPEQYSIADIYALPDGQRAELIHGQLYNMAPPGTLHQRMVLNLATEIRSYIKKHNGSCEIFPAPFAVFLNKDEKTYVEPDVCVICDKSKIDEKGCNGAPDFIIEVVSPSSRKMDYSTKNTLYSDAGVREYWIVDSRRKTVIVNYFEGNMLDIHYSFDSTIKVNIYDDLFINFSDITELLNI